MTRDPLISEPFVMVTQTVANMIASPLNDLLRKFHRDGGRPHAELVTTVDAIGKLARLARNTAPSAAGTPGIPPDDDEDTLGTVSTTAAAEHFGITDRAVRGRCERGSLAATKIAGTWRIWLDPERHAA